MNNFVQPGHSLELTVPGGGVVSGQGYKIGSIFGVALVTAAAAAKAIFHVAGVVELPKLAATAMSEGDKVGWDVGLGNVVPDAHASEDIKIGLVVAGALAGDAKVKVLLTPRPA